MFHCTHRDEVRTLRSHILCLESTQCDCKINKSIRDSSSSVMTDTGTRIVNNGNGNLMNSNNNNNNNRSSSGERGIDVNIKQYRDQISALTEQHLIDLQKQRLELEMKVRYPYSLLYLTVIVQFKLIYAPGRSVHCNLMN